MIKESRKALVAFALSYWKMLVPDEANRKDGTLLRNPAVKSNILDKLAESIFVYTAYPSSAQREQVAEALVLKHPCLRDPVSFNGL